LKPSILLTGKIPSSVVATLEEIGNLDHFRRDGVDLMPHDELVARVAGKQALVSMITDAVSRDVIEAGTDLKIIANAAVGYNNIDVAAARQRGIIVTNTPGVLIDATADLTWALILGITRRIGEGERLVRRGESSSDTGCTSRSFAPSNVRCFCVETTVPMTLAICILRIYEMTN